MKLRRLKSEDNVADLDTKAPNRSVITRHSPTLEFVTRQKESLQVATGRGDVLGLRFTARQANAKGASPSVRDEWQNSQLAESSGDHAKRSSRQTAAAATAAARDQGREEARDHRGYDH